MNQFYICFSPAPFRFPRPLGEDEGSGDRKCNEMQPNATEIKVLPLLPTPDELHNEDASPRSVPRPGDNSNEAR